MIIGSVEFKSGTHVMAIINLTPDSFYAESRKDLSNVLFAVEKAVNDGAEVIDVGAQSTRPGYAEVSAEEEISRFEKPLTLIKERFGVPLSVDTYFPASATAALQLGADMINDVWGLSRYPQMAGVIARYGASVCIMHNSLTPLQGDIWQPVLGFLQNSANAAVKAGISPEKICVDGGIGFAKNREQNFELLNGYQKLNALGYPTLLGCSRKSMFGGRVEDRLPQTLLATRAACEKKVLFVRVHDVRENVEEIKKFYSGGGEK